MTASNATAAARRIAARAIRPTLFLFPAQQARRQQHKRRGRNGQQQKPRLRKEQINTFHGDTSPIPPAAAPAAPRPSGAPDEYARMRRAFSACPPAVSVGG